MILVTGAEGLIGRYVCQTLKTAGVAYRPFDLKRHELEDICNAHAMAEAVRDVQGVVHLAAVSRVLWGERDPVSCDAVNVRALKNLLRICIDGRRPWFVFASSREVYGQADRFPVSEECPKRPINHYGKSKLEGEELVEAGAQSGLVANICRFSSVFGCPLDHADRVAMAFASAAAHGGRISVEGANNTFDFTSVRDVADALWRLIQATAAGERLPPIHFVSGNGTTLRELADMAVVASAHHLIVEEAPPRRFDVSRFIGDPMRAKSLLGWSATANLSLEFEQLVRRLACVRTVR